MAVMSMDSCIMKTLAGQCILGSLGEGQSSFIRVAYLMDKSC